MNKSLKILQIIGQNKLRSGGAIQMFLISRELVKMGHSVCALYNKKAHPEDDFKIFQNSGIDLQFLDMNRIKLNLATINSIKKLRKFLKNENFDIIHAHKGTAANLVWLASVGLNVNIVANRGVESPLDFFKGFKFRTHKIKKIIAVSQAVKNVMVKTGGVKPEKINVVYGSVDAEEFKPGISSTLRTEYNIPVDTKVIGYVGSALPRKGLEYLIEAFLILHTKFPNLILLLVGVTKDALDNFNINDNLKEIIIPTGFRYDVANCMAVFDIFAFSGIADEGLTGTVREAAAMGLPIVTTDVAGNTELIKNEENGLVVPKKNPCKIAKAIEFFIENEGKAGFYGNNARKFVVENMNNEVRVKKIEKIYYEILVK